VTLNLDIKPLGKKKVHPCYLKFEKISMANPGKNRIVSNGYFANSDMRCGHTGLAAIAKKRGINLDNLGVGDLVVFVNSKQDKVKVATAGYTLSYLRMPSGQRINPGVISLIPKFFNGGQINYSGALRQVIMKEFGQ